MPRLLPALSLTLLLAACAHAPSPTPRVLLLGEVHDNAAGHAARAELLQRRL